MKLASKALWVFFSLILISFMAFGQTSGTTKKKTPTKKSLTKQPLSKKAKAAAKTKASAKTKAAAKAKASAKAKAAVKAKDSAKAKAMAAANAKAAAKAKAAANAKAAAAAAAAAAKPAAPDTETAPSDTTKTVAPGNTDVPSSAPPEEPSQPAYADEQKPETETSEVAESQPAESSGSSEFLANGISLDLFISAATTIELKVGSEITYNTTPAAGLGVRYDYIRKNTFGFSIRAAVHSPRRIDSATGSGGTATFSGDLSYMYFSGEANGTYSFGNFYGFGGPNFTIVSVNNTSGTTYDPAAGLQFGAGYGITKDILVELLYQTLNVEVASSTTNYNYFRLWGPVVRGVYNF